MYRQKLLVLGNKLAFAVSILLVFIVMGCTTITTQYRLDPNSEVARYYDDSVVHTSIGDRSAVELRLRSSLPLILDLYVENLSNEAFDFNPDSVFYYSVEKSPFTPDGQSILFVIARGAPPDEYATKYGEQYGGSPITATGGVGAFLSGATIGEAMIAENQTRQQSAMNRAAEQATASQTRATLVGRTTLRPGESISGGIGMFNYNRSQIFVRSEELADVLYGGMTAEQSLRLMDSANVLRNVSYWDDANRYTMFGRFASSETYNANDQFETQYGRIVVFSAGDVHVFDLVPFVVEDSDEG